ncbi:MAG: hypothetical protein HY318_09365, partial [Armatimonadetes bacterium]|nr:hypothetical protein [Armatimonadota bacterium]
MTEMIHNERFGRRSAKATRKVLASLVFLAASTLVPSAKAFAQNLLVNADFRQGKPGDAGFGWTLDLAKGQKSECTVVQGRKPGTTALRLYNDELGASFVSQEIKVRPGRWYLAEVWVNTEGMATFDFSPTISLKGGSGVSGDTWIYDSFNWPQKGWRRLNAIAHLAEDDQISLKIGGGGIARAGGGWSGDLVFSDPVVRECSLVEAASRYPSVHNRHPALYGMGPDPVRNQQGYMLQRGDVCRVAPGFPNPLYLFGRRNNEALEARVSLALPPGVRFAKPEGRKDTVVVSDMSNGFQRVELPANTNELIVDTDLKPGEEAVGYIQFEWSGGYQCPAPVRFVGIPKPRIRSPKRAMVTLGIGSGNFFHWNDDEAALVRDLKGFGFNHLEFWGGDPRGFYKNGMYGITAWGGGPRVQEKNPEALAVTLDGNPCQEDLISPSYRGPALQPFIDRIRDTAKYSSALTLDDENYGCSAQSPVICFHPRTLERWSKWVSEHDPSLAGVEPRVFARQPHKYRKHYDAWLQFRCDLFAEIYGIMRDEFHKAVKASGVKTTERPMLGAYVGDSPVHGLESSKS